MHKPKVAFVYDWFDTSVGGAERVLQVLHEAYPDAPWYTSHVDLNVASWAVGWDIRPSFLQHLPAWFRRNRILSLPFLPFAFESFDLSGYDTVVSITSAFAKGIITNAQTRHICYLLTPPRWLHKSSVPNSRFKVVNYLIDKVAECFRRWDYVAAQRVDKYISISREVARRCTEYYGRESEVLYPPFDEGKWRELSQKYKKPETIQEGMVAGISNLEHAQPKYYLVVSRLEPYKKVDLAIEAFHQYRVQSTEYKEKAHNVKLVIVGSGSQKARLKALSSRFNIQESVIWVDGIGDEELARLYTHCKAIILPQEEDFGYVACEAMACGAPVVAYDRGGQTEILENYPLKALCDEQTAECFARALEKIGEIQYNASIYENRNIRGWGGDAFVATLSQKITQTV